MEKKQGAITPKVESVKSDWVNKDSIPLPKKILVDENKLKKIPAGKPRKVFVNNNIHIAGVPKVVIAGNPTVITPGTDTFLIPRKVPVIEKPFVANISEIFVVKDMTYKNQTTSSFSTFGKQHGLLHGIVTCLLKDRYGNLWFGTAGGVTKYDGRSFI
ncbi:MAG: two-component regulator propeller domain-containing protein, partial [Saprospiraceae bacterium]